MVFTTEEMFNDRKTRWPSVKSLSLFPQLPLCLLCGLLCKVAAAAETEALPRLGMDFLSPRLMRILSLLSFQPANIRKQCWDPAMVSGGRLVMFHSSHDMEQFLLIGIAFPACSDYARIKIFQFQNALFTVMVSHTTLLLTKELISQQMKCSNGHVCGIHWSYHKLHHPEAVGLLQWLTGFSKTQWQD